MLCLAVMVKNEEQSILNTLGSCAPYITHLRVLDTGSTDKTLVVVEAFAATHPAVHVLTRSTEFVNFEVSRNELLAFCDEDPSDAYDFLLLMDSNDILIGGATLVKCLTALPPQVNAVMVRQRWIYGPETFSTYFNSRVVRHRAGWRYKGVVHEYISGQGLTVNLVDNDVTIEQDRRINSESSGMRHHRDYHLLLAEHRRDPLEPRTLFYLAQTCQSIGRVDEAYYYYGLRVSLPENCLGFYEEVFHSHLRLGECAKTLHMDHMVVISHWMRALEKIPRAEPACRIAEYYLFDTKPPNYPLAYAFAKYACQLSLPNDCTLFVDDNDYTYIRYHLAGIASYYVKDMDFGREACERAVATRGLPIDKSNLTFYSSAGKSDVRTFSPATIESISLKA